MAESPPELAVDISVPDVSSPTPPSPEPLTRPLHHLLADCDVVLGNDGHAYLVPPRSGPPQALRCGSKAFNHFLLDRAKARDGGSVPKRAELAEIAHIVSSAAESNGRRTDVSIRVAKAGDGIEIDLGDEAQTRVRITSDGVKVAADSKAVFYRPPHMRALAYPAAIGSLVALDHYLPAKDSHRWLCLAWITYTIAHPKSDQTKYPLLVLTGSAGSGKSTLARLIQRLIDPHVVGVQVMPSSVKDIAIATSNSHLVLYDNIRSIPHYMADGLCIAATGGVLATRQLYSDAEQHAVQMHGPILMNGITPFIDQPDLAQRCLQLHLDKLPETSRRSEHDMEAELAAVLPEITRGLYDLISRIFQALPTSKITDSHRMYDFVRWLAAMEDVVGRPYLQELFVHIQAQGQRDALEENVLAAAVLQLAKNKKHWTGTPSALLAELRQLVPQSEQRSRDWPPNPIALSKRLVPMEPALREQGLLVEFKRGDERKITIANKGEW